MYTQVEKPLKTPFITMVSDIRIDSVAKVQFS